HVDVRAGADLAGEGHEVRAGHLVVREGEVAPPALDVEGGAEPVPGDHGALDVPAGAPAAERPTVPRGLALALGAPQQRVERVALAGALGVSPAFGELREARGLVDRGDRA